MPRTLPKVNVLKYLKGTVQVSFFLFVRPFERFMSDLMSFKNTHGQEMTTGLLGDSFLCLSCYSADPIILEQTHSTI